MECNSVSSPTRADILAALAHASAVLNQMHLLPATDGNFSARLDGNRILITASSIEKRSLAPDSLLEFDLNGDPPAGISSEWRMHRAVYQSRLSVNALLHVHAPALTAFAAAHCLPSVELLAEAKAAVGEIALVPYAAPGSQQLADAIVRASGSASVYLLENHGVLSLGASVKDALHRLERAEFLSRVELHARTLGGGIAIQDDRTNR
jgi:L-fuculose-phosphate aldolase